VLVDAAEIHHAFDLARDRIADRGTGAGEGAQLLDPVFGGGDGDRPTELDDSPERVGAGQFLVEAESVCRADRVESFGQTRLAHPALDAAGLPIGEKEAGRRVGQSCRESFQDGRGRPVEPTGPIDLIGLVRDLEALRVHAAQAGPPPAGRDLLAHEPGRYLAGGQETLPGLVHEPAPVGRRPRRCSHRLHLIPPGDAGTTRCPAGRASASGCSAHESDRQRGVSVVEDVDRSHDRRFRARLDA
jgi:hypothetical protein